MVISWLCGLRTGLINFPAASAVCCWGLVILSEVAELVSPSAVLKSIKEITSLMIQKLAVARLLQMQYAQVSCSQNQMMNVFWWFLGRAITFFLPLIAFLISVFLFWIFLLWNLLKNLLQSETCWFLWHGTCFNKQNQLCNPNDEIYLMGYQDIRWW